MSIVTLKKKSRRWQTPISGQGDLGFALNGTLRNHGSVGPTNLGKSVKRTPFRGNEPMGHGGCCGNYKIDIHNSGSCYTNNKRVVKRSVGNTRGLINQTLSFGRQTIQAAPGFEGIKEDLKRCQCPEGGGIYFGSRNIVKNPLWMTQHEYILYKIVAKNAGVCGETKRVTNFKGEKRRCEGGDILLAVSGNTCNSGIPGTNFIGTRRITNKCTIAKPDNNGVIDMSTYLRGLVYKNNCLPQFNNLPYTKYNIMPIPQHINQHACGDHAKEIVKNRKVIITSDDDVKV